MWQQVKTVLTTQAGFYTGLFACLAIGGWVSNGLHGTHFVLNDLMQIYGWIVGQLAVKHGIDSALNSPKGEKP